MIGSEKKSLKKQKRRWNPRNSGLDLDLDRSYGALLQVVGLGKLVWGLPRGFFRVVLVGGRSEAKKKKTQPL